MTDAIKEEFFEACGKTSGDPEETIENCMNQLCEEQLVELLIWKKPGDPDTTEIVGETGCTGLERALYLKNTKVVDLIVQHVGYVNPHLLQKCHFLESLSKKNQYGQSAFKKEEDLEKNICYLDIYAHCFLRHNPDAKCKTHDPDADNCGDKFNWSLSQKFKEFHPVSHDESRKCIPFDKTFEKNPLTAIGDSGHLALIHHPYVQFYVDACWNSFARQVYRVNLVLFLLFWIFMSLYITTHKVDIDPVTGRRKFTSEAEGFTHLCRIVTIILAIVGLIFEVFQMRIKRFHYLKNPENHVDVLVFLGALVVTLVPLGIDYDVWVHTLGCVLILTSGIRSSWTLTHIKYMGNKFRMVLAVVTQVFIFSPILLLFVLMFALVYHALFSNQETFSNFGISLMKTMAMTVGELDFSSVYFADDNNKTFEIMGLIFFVVFLGIMTISMMNLLIGVAVGDIVELQQKGDQSIFRGQVELILEYCYMFERLSNKLHYRDISEFSKWRKMDSTEGKSLCGRLGDRILYHLFGLKSHPDSKSFTKYIDKLELNHKQYLADIGDDGPDMEAIEEKLEALDEKISRIESNIEKLVEKMNSTDA